MTLAVSHKDGDIASILSALADKGGKFRASRELIEKPISTPEDMLVKMFLIVGLNPITGETAAEITDSKTIKLLPPADTQVILLGLPNVTCSAEEYI